MNAPVPDFVAYLTAAMRDLDRLRGLAETLLPESSPVKTAENPAPIVMPTVEDVALVIFHAIWGPSAIFPTGTDSMRRDFTRVARDVLDLFASCVPHWVPIEWDAIRPGMTVRATSAHARIELVVGEVDLYVVRGVHGGVWMRDAAFARTWEVDPRTVPAVPTEPEDPGVAVVREWVTETLKGDREDAIRDLLTRIDAARADQWPAS